LLRLVGGAGSATSLTATDSSKEVVTPVLGRNRILPAPLSAKAQRMDADKFFANTH